MDTVDSVPKRSSTQSVAKTLSQRQIKCAPYFSGKCTGNCARPWRCKAFEAHICALLKQLDSTNRREVVASYLSQQQRLALESWMRLSAARLNTASEQNASKRCPQKCPSLKLTQQKRRCCNEQVATGNPCDSRAPTATHDKRKRRRLADPDKARASPSDSQVNPSADDGISITSRPVMLASAQVRCGRAVQRQVSNRLPTAGTKGIHCRRDRQVLYYRAHVTAGPIRLHTVYTPDIGKAHLFQVVLKAMQARILQACRCGAREDIVAAVLTAIEEEPRTYECDLKDMGLSISAQVRAACWIGQALPTPAFSARSARVGLEVWQSLEEAHGIDPQCVSEWHQCGRYTVDEWQLAWQRLRVKYLEVWAKYGARSCTPARIAARLSMLEAKHFPRKKERASTLAAARTQFKRSQVRSAGRVPKAYTLGSNENQPRSQKRLLASLSRLVTRWSQHLESTLNLRAIG